MSKEEYCPTRGGSFTAYEPQWQHPEDGWIATPMEFIQGGVPFPLSTGGVLSTIGLCSRHQALAIVHAFGAVAEAEGRTVAVRVWPYYVQYDIKARAMESDEAVS